MALSPELLARLGKTQDELAGLLVNDVQDIFKTMVGLDGLLALAEPAEPIATFRECISSLVGMGGAVCGIVSVHMPNGFAMKATGGMLGVEVQEMNEEVHDAIGEIANMIAGSFKFHFSKGGADIMLSIPSIITGMDYVVSLGTNTEQIALRFAVGEYWFVVAVAFENNRY